MMPAASLSPRQSALAMPIAATIASILFIQSGASVAKTLFPLGGPAGVTALRLVFASLMMLALWRPWRTPLRPGAMRHIAAYGVVLGTMNLSFYAALSRIPLGIAVALEFTGPLGLALLHSSRRFDVVWVLVAAVGVYLLLPIGAAAGTLDPVGIGLALFAGFCWALYIVFGQKAGALGQAQAAAYGVVIACLVAAPFGIVLAGSKLLDPAVLRTGLLVAALSSAVPYSLEMIAMTRLPAKIFGILMSLEPALAALSGFVILGERLTGVQLAAIALVVAASAGTVATNRPAQGMPMDA
jgi:inner membrane transporter RhtA